MKKELLFITSQLPYPPYQGGVMTSWNLISFFAENFSTSMITLLKWEDPKFEAEFLSKVELEDYFSFELNIERTPATVIKSYLKGVPINLVRNYHPAVEEKIHSVIDDYQYVVVDHYEMFQYIPDRAKAKTIMHEHNAEFIMWKRYSEVATNPLKKLVTSLESGRIRKKEKEFCEKADMVLAYPNDKAILDELTEGNSRIETIIPFGEDFMLDWDTLQWENTEESLLYIGSMSWEANTDGLIWFITEGWEKLKAKRPELKFYLVGGNPDPRLKALAAKHRDIILTGFVDDLEDYYAKCRVFVSPLRFGSGIKLKVLNSMFRGLPVVTTPIGSEGMFPENGVHLYQTHDMDEYVDYCEELLTNQQSWETLRDNSRVLTRERFSRKAILDKMKENILSLNGTVRQA